MFSYFLQLQNYPIKPFLKPSLRLAFEKLGLTLPPAPIAFGSFINPYLIDGKYLYLSGHGPV
jgi:hypothetical protein